MSTTDRKKVVFVGLSGGVDSSVAAWRLQRQGFYVVGVFIKVWHPDFLECNWQAERLDAMRVAATLGIPFLTCDAEETYRQLVAEYFIQEYLAGRTPNPDVMCNTHVKFGAFLEFARLHKADYIATGHYAQRIDSKEMSHLHRGIDTTKDQTYFLWNLTQEQLRYTLFPIGDSPKDTIRKEASSAGLHTEAKKDSQGICFLGHVDIPEFIAHYTTLNEGVVLNEHGVQIGTHRGALVYTLGQRHGFTLSVQQVKTLPHFVVDRNIEQNTITVSSTKPTLSYGKTFSIASVNWIANTKTTGEIVNLQSRYRQPPSEARISNTAKESLFLEPFSDIDTPTVGQSCVLYTGTECLGGGIIA